MPRTYLFAWLIPTVWGAVTTYLILSTIENGIQKLMALFPVYGIFSLACAFIFVVNEKTAVLENVVSYKGRFDLRIFLVMLGLITSFAIVYSLWKL